VTETQHLDLHEHLRDVGIGSQTRLPSRFLFQKVGVGLQARVVAAAEKPAQDYVEEPIKKLEPPVLGR